MKRTINLLSVVMLLISFSSFGQAPPLSWSKVFSGAGYEMIYDMVIDGNNNVIVVGGFLDTLNINTGTGNISYISNGGYDMFVVKLDSAGNYIWSKHYGGTNSDVANSVTTDPNDNVVIAGSFHTLVDFNPGFAGNSLSSLNSNSFTLKLNSSGGFVWVRKNTTGTSWSYANDVITDNNGNVYSTGIFAGIPDFNPGPGVFLMTSTVMTQPQVGSYGFAGDYFLQKFDSNGIFKWVVSGEDTLSYSSGYSSRRGVSLAIDDNQNVYLLGSFYRSCDFKPGPGKITRSTNGQSDAFILKLDSMGSYQWVKTVGGTSVDYPRDVRISDQGEVYFTLNFQGVVDIDPGLNTINKSSAGQFDMALIKLNLNGNFTWGQTYGSTGADEFTDFEIDQFGYLVITGVFSGITDFDHSSAIYNLSALYTPEFFILKINSNGGFEWADALDSQTGLLTSFCITISQSSKIYSAGYFYGTIDLDMGVGQDIHNSTSPLIYDAIVFKLDDCLATTDTLTVSVCNSFLSPSGLHNWGTSGIYYDTIPNNTGCDSLITIHLTVGSTDSLFIVSCDSFTFPKTLVTWDTSGVFIDSSLNSNGCDSISIYSLNIHHSSFDTNFVTACDSFISPINSNVLTTSGFYVDSFNTINGCDSILILSLTIYQTSYTSINEVVCDSIVSPSGNSTWYSTGSYLDTLSNTNGCDSIILVNLTVNNSSNMVIDTSVCNFYISTFDNSIWTSSGTYYEPYISSYGCDSSRTINLTVVTIDATISVIFDSTITPNSLILWSNASGNFTYQWLNCDNSNTPIVGAINQYYIPQNSGNYAVIVSSSSCSITSDCFNVSGLSVVYLSGFNQISLYPNPTRGLVNIRQEKANSITIQVLDITGKVLLITSSNNQLTTVDLSGFVNGVYLVKVNGDQGVSVAKVIKE